MYVNQSKCDAFKSVRTRSSRRAAVLAVVVEKGWVVCLRVFVVRCSRRLLFLSYSVEQFTIRGCASSRAVTCDSWMLA